MIGKSHKIIIPIITSVASIFTFSLSASAETILNYEFPSADAVYLNICSLEYRSNTGRCSTINLVNRKVPGKYGTARISEEHLPHGDRAWAVFVVDRNGARSRCAAYKSIIGGKYYAFGPGCDGFLGRD